MPHRLVCVAILLFWAVASVALVTRDLLPELLIGSPPDLRTISKAETDPGPTRWTILVEDKKAGGQLVARSVGQAETRTTLKDDGWVQMIGAVWLDAAGLLKGTPFETISGERLELLSTYDIDPSGNLFAFQARVRPEGDAEDLVSLEGRVDDDWLVVRAEGPLPLFRWTRKFPYQPRGMVQNALGPMDRMPGLQVGQRWESRIVSPLTGRVESVRVEVARKTAIAWANEPVVTLEVVARSGPLAVRIWVDRKGMVLRQEVPFPFTTLILERLPADATGDPGPPIEPVDPFEPDEDESEGDGPR